MSVVRQSKITNFEHKKMHWGVLRLVELKKETLARFALICFRRKTLSSVGYRGNSDWCCGGVSDNCWCGISL